jgi:hypothetical protein
LAFPGELQACEVSGERVLPNPDYSLIFVIQSRWHLLSW